MADDLFSVLVSKPQRETAGSDVSARFDYQKNWAFCEMLKRHIAGADYLVAFEFHDDVLFLRPSANPTDAEFFQVKTSKAATERKLSSLTHQPTKSSSILGKLFSNLNGLLAGKSIKVVLVSNVAFEFSGKDLVATDLDPKFRDQIVKKLAQEIPGFSEAHLGKLHFMISGVSLDAMDSFLTGEAMKLFTQRFGEEHGYNVHSWIRLVQGEIRRKNNYGSDLVKSVDDLITNKCIDRSRVDATLNLMSSKKRPSPNMVLVTAELSKSGWTMPDLMRLEKQMSRAIADYTDSLNLEASAVAERMRQIFSGGTASPPSLAEFIASVQTQLAKNVPKPYRDPIYLAAMGIVTFHDKV